MFEIRAATTAELGDVLGFWRRAGDPTPTDSPVALRLLLDRDPEALLLAEDERGIVGTLIAAWDGWRGSLYRLAVDPERRRAGIATALVRAGEERLRGLGAVRLTAIVVEGDAVAGALWEAVGYERRPSGPASCACSRAECSRSSGPPRDQSETASQTIPTAISPIAATRPIAAGSPRKTMPAMAAPTAPVPVHTA